MADQDSAQEKTLEPTQRKLEKEHEKGNFARSKEITTVGGFIAALLFLGMGEEYMIERLSRAGRFFLEFDRFLDLRPDNIGQFLIFGLYHLLPILLPLFGLIFIAGVSSELAQIGFRVVKNAFEPKWNRLDPAAGFKRIFSARQLMEGLKSMVKMAIFGIMIVVTVRDVLPPLTNLSQNSPQQGLRILFGFGLKLALRTSILLAFLAGFDYWFQRRQYFKKLRMSHQEFKDEMKESQGDPILKQRMRSIQMEIARKRMMSAVPKSDVVIVNPTHYAVALSYEPEKNHAPILVAKGQNYIALRIREVAEEAGVPIIENAPLARAIHKQVEVGKPIPGALFKAVAQILASIWKLAEKRGRSWAAPEGKKAA
jgi:flagellar biosynthetic protein FlhB